MNEYEKRVEEKIATLGAAPPDVAAATLCACAERFIPLYDDFFRVERWGQPELLRKTLDQAWNNLMADTKQSLATFARSVHDATPDGDDFDSIETTFAQNAADLVAAAAEASGGDSFEVGALYAAFETLAAAATDVATGYLDLGDSPEAEEFEARLHEHPLIVKEFAAQDADLADLRDRPLTRERIDALRARAVAHRWTTAALLAPTEPP